MHKSTRRPTLFTYPDGVRSMGIHLSNTAIKWLGQTVIDNLGNEVVYLDLFNDLLARFSFRKGEREFYRQLDVRSGQAQISENLLVSRWHMGRKRIHRILLDMAEVGLISLDSDRTASVVTFICVYDWISDDGYRYENVFYRFHNLTGNGAG